MSIIFERTSIRKYESKPVEQEKVEQLLRAAMAAPSAGNQQPWEFYVVTDKERMKKLAACSPYAGCAEHAPLVIVCCYRKENVLFSECVPMDLSACTQNLLLEAVELGLGAVWLGIAPLKERMEAVKEVLELPEGIEAFALVPCGYAAEEKVQQDRFERERVHMID